MTRGLGKIQLGILQVLYDMEDEEFMINLTAATNAIKLRLYPDCYSIRQDKFFTEFPTEVPITKESLNVKCSPEEAAKIRITIHKALSGLIKRELLKRVDIVIPEYFGKEIVKQHIASGITITQEGKDIVSKQRKTNNNAQ